MGFVHARNGFFCAQLNMKYPYQIRFLPVTLYQVDSRYLSSVQKRKKNI